MNEQHHPPTLPEILGDLDNEELSSSPEPVRVPLVIYVGDDRRIVGDAIVKGNEIEAFIEPAKGRDLVRLVQDGTINSVSVTFNAPPAIPVLGENGHVRWKKDY